MEAGLPLTHEMMLVLGILGFTVLMFVFEWVRVDVTALLILVILGITQLVPGEQLFDGFASNAVMAIIAVMIMGAGLDRTGVMTRAASGIMRLASGAEGRLGLLLSGFAGAISGFMQNPAVTTLFLPVAARIASRTGLPISGLLMPMAFCVILGGTLTMVGSSPLIVLNDLLLSANRNLPQGVQTLQALPMFAVTPIGGLLLLVGLIYFGLLGKRILPRFDSKQSVTPGRTESYFANVYGIDGEVSELLVTAESPLVGMSIGEAETQADAPLILALKSGNEARLAPPAEEMIWVGSVLGVFARKEHVADYAQKNLARPLLRLRNFGDLFNPMRAGISEAVIPPGSSFVGKTAADLKLRKRYGISVLAINRGEEIFREDVRLLPFKVGDCLVIHSFWRDLAALAEERDLLVVTDYPKEEQRPNKLWFAVLFFLLAIGLAISGLVPLPIAMLSGAVGMLLAGVLSMDEAYKAVSWKTVFLFASLIPLSVAMDSTGTAAWLVQELIYWVGDLPSWVLQAALAVAASLFAMVMSNVGATVLLVPMAINLALATGGNPAMYALIVALAASNNFISASNPVLSIISGPGGYRSRDFIRAGLPLSVLFIALMLVGVNGLYWWWER